MRRHPHLKRCTRLRLALLAIVALLFQQTALASCVCACASLPADNMAMAMHCHCHGMPMAQAKYDPGLCVSHCAHNPISVPNISSPQVPPLVLPALLPADMQVASILPPAASHYVHDSPHRSRGVSPELRFDVLLI